MQVAQPTLKPKPAKELAYTNAQTEKFAAKMRERITKEKNGQLVTACKRHSPAAGATQGYDRLHANRWQQAEK